MKWSSMFMYGEINTRDVVRLEKSVTKSQVAGECFLDFRMSHNISRVYITVYNMRPTHAVIGQASFFLRV